MQLSNLFTILLVLIPRLNSNITVTAKLNHLWSPDQRGNGTHVVLSNINFDIEQTLVLTATLKVIHKLTRVAIAND